MTLRHKIKLVFCRITWWLGITEKARNYYNALQDYYHLYNIYNVIAGAYLEQHRKRPDAQETYKLKGQAEILAKILDIKR